ncbi:hypothetical protein A2U01_0059154, partial [Trifolium medium]|nr:hypothetical protein [Trifolium medium]
FGLGRLILASLYDSLIEGCDLLKKGKDEKNSKKGKEDKELLLAGPIWFLQL